MAETQERTFPMYQEVDGGPDVYVGEWLEGAPLPEKKGIYVRLPIDLEGIKPPPNSNWTAAAVPLPPGFENYGE
ncbi:MAG: hypothetical protein AAF267_19155 [Deinococcota bacterium]